MQKRGHERGAECEDRAGCEESVRTEREDRAECEAFGRMVHMIVKAGGRPPDCVPCVKVSVRRV